MAKPTQIPGEDLPSQFELALLAAILKVAHGAELGTPDNHSIAKDALDLWRQCSHIRTKGPQPDQEQKTGLRVRRPGDLNLAVQAALKRTNLQTRAKGAARTRWSANRRKAEEVLNRPTTYPCDFATFLELALPETPAKEDRDRLFQEWQSTCRKTERDWTEKMKSAGCGEKDFELIGPKLLSWYLDRNSKESATPAD